MEGNKPIAVNACFEVAYEDADVIVVDKAAPLLVHPTKHERNYTLLQGVQELLAYELATGGTLSWIAKQAVSSSSLKMRLLPMNSAVLCNNNEFTSNTWPSCEAKRRGNMRVALRHWLPCKLRGEVRFVCGACAIHPESPHAPNSLLCNVKNQRE